MEANIPLLEVKDIKKSFYGVPVLKGIDFSLYNGDCVSLIGENGAGKSTLIKIMCGIYSKDFGEIYIKGERVEINKREDAKRLGISVIYQELSLFKDLTVYENIFINSELTRSNRGNQIAPLKIKEMRDEAKKLLHDKLKINLDVDKKISDTTFAEKQMVEIARALYSNSDIIIMDEPTTALEHEEKKILFNIIKNLRSQGKAIIFISHHLDETFENCNRTVVLRDGEIVLTENTCDITEEQLVQSMIGKSFDNYYPKVKYQLGEKILSVKGLASEGKFNDISFDLHKKEILGIVGLAGCGKYEIIRALFGVEAYDKGTIEFHGNKIKNKTIKEAKENGFAFLSSDRKGESIFGVQDVNWNTTIANLDAINNIAYLSLKKEEEITKQYVKDLSIKITSQDQRIVTLSGGNQQKVMLSRWFLCNPEILLLEEPTRGIDVSAKTDVYRLIMDYVSKGKGVVVVSSEEEEVLGICDNIIVIRDGEIVCIYKNDEKMNLERLKLATKFNLIEEGQVQCDI